MDFTDLFSKYAEWRVLRFVLETTSPVYVGEASRKAKVSKGTASKSLNFLEKAGLAKSEKVGNLRMFQLEDSALVRQLKVLVALAKIGELKLAERFTDEDPSIASLVLYGSFADGTYDKKSDLDLLVISESGKDFSGLLDSLEKDLDREVSLLRYKSSDLAEARRKDKAFYWNLSKNHIILYGSKLP